MAGFLTAIEEEVLRLHLKLLRVTFKYLFDG